MAVTVLFSGAAQVRQDQTYYARPYGFEFAIGEGKLFDATLAEQCGRPTDNDGADFAEMFCADENLHLDQYNRMNPKPFTVQVLAADPPPPAGPPPVLDDDPPSTLETPDDGQGAQ